MACMTWECLSCGEMWHNNETNSICPKCGNDNVVYDYDEVEYDYDDDTEEEEW